MKKLTIFLLALLLCFSAVGCASTTDSLTNVGASTSLLGNKIPRPSMAYDVITSSKDSVYLEVKNATEQDFRQYVDSCRAYGFDGEIMSATVPDLYYREYNADNYFLEVRYMKAEQEFSVYICAPKN